MIIFGFDPGTYVSGFGIIVYEELKYWVLDYGCIRPPRGFSLPERCLIIFESVEQLIEKYAPEAFVVETQYVKKNVQVAIKLGMARGAAIVAAGKRGVKVHEYAPATAKRAVTGTGRASKQQVQGMVQRKLALPMPPTPEDAADALALAICHAHRCSDGR